MPPWCLGTLALLLTGLALSGCSSYPLGRQIDPPFDAQLLTPLVQVPPGGTGELRVRITPQYPTPQLPVYSWVTWAHSDGCPEEVIVTTCAISGSVVSGLEPFEWDVTIRVRPDVRPGTYGLALNYGNEGTRRRLPFTLEVRP